MQGPDAMLRTDEAGRRRLPRFGSSGGPGPGTAWFAAVCFVEPAVYAVLIALLPAILAMHHLPDKDAGLLVAGHPTGMVAALVPTVLLLRHGGYRATALVGLALLALSCLLIPLASTAAALVGTRVIGGAGALISWAGAVGWAAATTEPERRGELFGVAVGAGFAGTALGCVLGAVGAATDSVLLAFGPLVLAIGVTALAAPRADVQRPQQTSARAIAQALRRSSVVVGILVVVASGMMAGIMGAIVPLRLRDLGLATSLIGLVLVCAYMFQAAISRLVGRAVDRRGAGYALLIASGIGAAAAAAAPIATSLVPAALLPLTAQVSAMTLFGPATTAVSAGGSSASIDQGVAVMGTSGGWALGAAAGGLIVRWAHLTPDRVLTYVVATAILLAVAAAGLGLQRIARACRPLAIPDAATCSQHP